MNKECKAQQSQPNITARSRDLSQRGEKMVAFVVAVAVGFNNVDRTCCFPRIVRHVMVTFVRFETEIIQISIAKSIKGLLQFRLDGGFLQNTSSFNARENCQLFRGKLASSDQTDSAIQRLCHEQSQKVSLSYLPGTV